MWRGISLWNKCFSLVDIGHNYWHPIITTSFCQNNSCVFSCNTWWICWTPDKRSETIPSSRISPDPSDSQLLLFSSPHSCSTGFRSEDWNGQQKLGFVLSDPFLCCFWGLFCFIVLVEDPNMAHYKISNRVSQV